MSKIITLPVITKSFGSFGSVTGLAKSRKIWRKDNRNLTETETVNTDKHMAEEMELLCAESPLNKEVILGYQNQSLLGASMSSKEARALARQKGLHVTRKKKDTPKEENENFDVANKMLYDMKSRSNRNLAFSPVMTPQQMEPLMKAKLGLPTKENYKDDPNYKLEKPRTRRKRDDLSNMDRMNSVGPMDGNAIIDQKTVHSKFLV